MFFNGAPPPKEVSRRCKKACSSTVCARNIRIRRAEPNNLRLSTPYYLSKEDIDRFLDAFDEYRKIKG